MLDTLHRPEIPTPNLKTANISGYMVCRKRGCITQLYPLVLYRSPINRSTARKRPKYSSNTPSNPLPPPSTKSTLQCPICLDTAQQFESSGRSLVTTVCGHIFCNVCIRNSIQRQHKCPTCRKKLTLKQYHELFV